MVESRDTDPKAVTQTGTCADPEHSRWMVRAQRGYIELFSFRMPFVWYAEIFRDGVSQMCIGFMFTCSGVLREAWETAERIAAGETPQQIELDSYHARQGW